MIKHIVCYKLKDSSKPAAEKARQILLSMEGRVPMIRSINVGVDIIHSERSYDLVLKVVLDDLDALEACQGTPYHKNTVKPFMHNAREGSVSVDYAF